MIGKRLAILSLVFLSQTVLSAGTTPKSLLRDGFVLMGVDGTLTWADSNEGWFFEFDSGVSDDSNQIHTGASLELLPSTALEKMTDDANNRPDAGYRLWGRITKYKGRNFIFPIYFLPLSKTKKLSTSQQQEIKPAINEPNDALALPKEIIEKLKPEKIVRTTQLRKGLELQTDSILANRTGFIRNGGREVSFVPDALGRNIRQISFTLLPCETLEWAQRTQSAEAEPVRFKIAGILTQYKGDYYLLLQRAIRVYSYQNFPR